MTAKEELKRRVAERIDQCAGEILSIGEEIFRHPELGFKEENTSRLAAEVFRKLGLSCREHLALTGVKAVAPGKAPGPRVMVMGELDAVISPLHPHSDDRTGAAHACGHNAQIAAMLGAAMGLVPFMDQLSGEAVFFAVPAEEYVELEYREKLRQEGKIQFLSGKQELIRLGEFDDVDMGMMVHSQAGMKERRFLLGGGSSGFVAKLIRFTGKEAHAGAEPFAGVNALNAAALSLMAIHAQRETFRDEDHIRVHPIITKGGDLVNIVPADVRMETYVRGTAIDAIVDASEKVNRAILGSAMAIGARAEITEIPGYLPLQQSPEITRLFGENAAALIGEEGCLTGYDLLGSTDAGDMSCLMPFVHVCTGGYAGTAHSKDFCISDPEMAYLMPAKAMAMTVVDLLWDGGAEAKKVLAGFQPSFTRDSYVEFWSGFNKTIS